jgi:hypothetical protein
MYTSQKTNIDNSLLQKEKEVIKNSFSLLPSSKLSSTDNTFLATKRTSLTSQNTKISNTIIKAKTIHTPPNSQPLTKIHASDTIVSSHAYSDSHIIDSSHAYSSSHAYRTSHKSLNTKDKNTSHQISNFPCTKTHSRELSDNSYTRQILMPINNPNQQNNKKQTILSQYDQINTIKKHKKDKKKLKEEKEDIGSPTKCNKDKKKKDIVDSQTIDPLTKNSEEKANHKPICYKCNKPGHYQNNCKPPKNKSKLNIPELHSEINSLKQEIQEIKNSSFQITKEQLAQEMVTLKINNNHSQNSSIENEVEPEENCKQIVQLISQPTSKETFLNTIDKMLFQKWYTEVRIVIDK